MGAHKWGLDQNDRAVAVCDQLGMAILTQFKRIKCEQTASG